MIHTVLGFFMCSIAYTGFVVTTNNLHKLLAGFRIIDSVLAAITGHQSQIRNYSNRFQMNLIVNGSILYIVITALDTVTYKM